MSPYYDAHTGASGEPRHPAKKLICDFKDKHEYTVHYRALQVYLRLGLELISVEKVLTFTQTPWLRAFVQHNAAKRQAACAAENKAEGDHNRSSRATAFLARLVRRCAIESSTDW